MREDTTRQVALEKPAIVQVGANRRLQGLLSALRIALILGATLVSAVPFLWLVVTGFKYRTDIMSPVPRLLFTPTLSNFHEAFIEGAFLQYLWNSLIVALGTVGLCLVTGVPAAYAFSRFRVFGAKHLFFFILTTRMAPGVAFALPLYILFDRLRLLGTIPGVVLAHTTFNLAIVIYLMKALFDEIPREIDHAALVDGYSEWETFTRVIVPVAKPAIAATALLAFIFSWNEFLFALILGGEAGRTLPAAFPGLVTALGTYWGQLAAASAVVSVPVIVLATLVQGYLVRGLTLGAVKG